MTSGRDHSLCRHTAPVDAEAVFCATRRGRLALIEPVTPAARASLEANVNGKARWLGPALAGEVNHSPPLSDATIAAGFRLEREAYRN